MKPVVYLDMLFLLNFLINSVTLYTSSYLARRPLSFLRVILAASFSALYSTVMFFPQITFLYSVLFKALFLLLTVWLAFPTKKIRLLLKNAVIFFSVNLIFGGMAFALIFATSFGTTVGAAVSNGEIYLNIRFEILLFSTVLAYAAAYAVSYIKAQAKTSERTIFNITICFRGRQITEKALCDTGCTLCDPISGHPAVIISPDCAKKLLSENFFKGIFDELENKYRILPFTTIGSQCGALHGFVPDMLLIDGQKIECSIIAVSKAPIGKNADFSAVFNPKLLETPLQRKAVNNNEKAETPA